MSVRPSTRNFHIYLSFWAWVNRFRALFLWPTNKKTTFSLRSTTIQQNTNHIWPMCVCGSTHILNFFFNQFETRNSGRRFFLGGFSGPFFLYYYFELDFLIIFLCCCLLLVWLWLFGIFPWLFDSFLFWTITGATEHRPLPLFLEIETSLRHLYNIRGTLGRPL